jgi:4-hydroxybenzoate polyprenyltransferase
VTTAPQPDPLHAPWGASITHALRDIKLAHSVFALPFAVLAAFMVAGARGPIDAPRFAGQLTLVVVCMVLARTWAMLVNRLADRRFDAQNPRTAGRAIPAGRLTASRGLALAAASALAFELAAAGFWIAFDNPWPTILGPAVLAWIALYSFTKRFTALCHVFLGGALAVSPVAAVIAIDPDLAFAWPGAGVFEGPMASVVWLAGFVLLWVAGFDVAYALQDLDFDRAAGLRSIPAAAGWRGAMWISRGMHGGALGCLILAWNADPRLGWAFGAACAIVAATLLAEHLVLARQGLKGLPMAFFTLNGVVSMTLGLLGVLDVLWAS